MSTLEGLTTTSYQLSDVERRVLAAAIHEADGETKHLAARTGLKPHVIRYTLERLWSRGVILARVPFINLYPLGFINFNLYFSLAPMKARDQAGALALMKKTPEVTWLASLAGSYQHTAGFTVQDPRRIEDVLQTLAQRFGVRIASADLVVTTRFEAHGERHLMPSMRVQSFSMGGKAKGDPLDPLEIAILRVMARGEYRSLRDLARGLNQSSATVTRKVRQLEDRGIIQGYILRLDPELARLSRYRLLIQAPGKSGANRKAIESFIKQSPEVINSSDCLGAWNHELTIAVQSVKRLEQMRNSLIEELSLAGAGPITVQIVQMIYAEKFAPFSL